MAEETTGQATEQPDDVSKIAALLEAEDNPQQEAEAEQTEEEKPVEEEAKEEEGESITLDPDAPLFDVTVKLQGGADETKKVSLTELTKGYMMQADYQRKTAELSKARETMQQEVLQQVEPMRNAYMQNLQFLNNAVHALVMPELQNVDIEKLSTENPAEFVKLNAKAMKVQQTLQQMQQAYQQQVEESRQQQIRQSLAALKDPINGIPNWGDELYNTLISEGSKYGFNPDEVANVTDHRMIRVLHDAMKYRQLQEKKPELTKKVALAPKVVKPGAAQESSKANRVKELNQRLKKSGDLRDAAALLLELENAK